MIQVQPHEFREWHLIVTGITSFVIGGGGVRFLIYVSKNMPALPKDAGWWTQFIYSLMKGASGLDPSAAIIPPPAGGSVK